MYLFNWYLINNACKITVSLYIVKTFLFILNLYFFYRVISRAPGLKLVVQTLLSSLRPIGNIVLICCTFFIIFGILGVQVKNVCRKIILTFKSAQNIIFMVGI